MSGTRPHHFRFAKVCLPQLILSDPLRFWSTLNKQGKGYVPHVWRVFGEQLPVEDRLSADGLGFELLFVNEQFQIAWITLPQPLVPNECYYIAAIAPTNAAHALRLFYLERTTEDPNYQFATIIAERTPTGRILYADNIEPDKSSFLTWVVTTMVRGAKPLTSVTYPPEKHISQSITTEAPTSPPESPEPSQSQNSNARSSTHRLDSHPQGKANLKNFIWQWIFLNAIGGLVIGLLDPLIVKIVYGALGPPIIGVSESIYTILPIPLPIANIVLRMIEGAYLGAVIGFVQWQVLKKRMLRTQAKAWAIITTIVIAIGWAFPLIVGVDLVSSFADSDIAGAVIFCTIFSFIAGAYIGCSQALVLLNRDPGKIGLFIFAILLGGFFGGLTGSAASGRRGGRVMPNQREKHTNYYWLWIFVAIVSTTVSVAGGVAIAKLFVTGGSESSVGYLGIVLAWTVGLTLYATLSALYLRGALKRLQAS